MSDAITLTGLYGRKTQLAHVDDLDSVQLQELGLINENLSVRQNADRACKTWNHAARLDERDRARTGRIDARWWSRRRQAIARLRRYAKRLARLHMANSGFPADLIRCN